MSATVVVLISVKGGSGSSTISVSLADALQRKGPVTLVDGDVMGRRNIAVLTDSVRPLDAMRQGENFSVARVASSLTVVEMSPSFDAGFTIKMAEVEPLARSVCDESRYVILDANQPFSVRYGHSPFGRHAFSSSPSRRCSVRRVRAECWPNSRNSGSADRSSN